MAGTYGRWQLQSGWKGHTADGSDRVDGRDIWQMAVTEQMAETQWTAGMYGG